MSLSDWFILSLFLGYVEHIRVCAIVAVMCAVGVKPLGILS